MLRGINHNKSTYENMDSFNCMGRPVFLRGVAGVEAGASVARREPFAADRVAAVRAHVGGFVKASALASNLQP
jgi:hypothetical protein